MSRKHDRATARAQKSAATASKTRELHAWIGMADELRRPAVVQQFVTHLHRLNASDVAVWPLVIPLLAGLTDPVERDELGALVALIVNPRLAGRRTPGSVDERRARGTPPGGRKPPRDPDRPREGQDHP